MSAQDVAVKAAREKSRQLHDIMQARKAEYFAAKKTYEASVNQLFSVIDFGPDSQLALFPNEEPAAESSGEAKDAAADEKKSRKPAAKKVKETDWRLVKVGDAIAVGAVTNALEKLEPPVVTLGGLREWLEAGNSMDKLPGVTEEKAALADQQFREFWAKNPQFANPQPA